MSKFMKGIKGVQKETIEIKAADIDAIAEKLHAPTPTETVAEPQKRVIVEEEKEELHRLTLDIPKEVFEQMKKDTKRRGQTIKGFIVSLIYDHYEK